MKVLVTAAKGALSRRASGVVGIGEIDRGTDLSAALHGCDAVVHTAARDPAAPAGLRTGRVKGNFASLTRIFEKGPPLPFGAVRNARSLLYLGNLTDIISLRVSHETAAGRIFLPRMIGCLDI